MSADEFIAARVPSQTKARLRAIAEKQHLSESALLKRCVDFMLTGATGEGSTVVAAPSVARNARLTIRLEPEDQLLLHDRAAARGMASATYVSVLVRSHLRSLAPLPKEELLALKRTIGELAAVGRNLNQIARAANQAERMAASGREYVGVMLKICNALRDHVKALLVANLRSWEQGHAEPGA